MAREVLISHLIGRVVRDTDGCKIGRIEELLAQIQLHDDGNDYIVTEFHVGAYGLLEALTGSVFARRFLQRMGPIAGYRLFRIPWEWMDLTDPDHPRLDRSQAQLEALDRA